MCHRPQDVFGAPSGYGPFCLADGVDLPVGFGGVFRHFGDVVPDAAPQRAA